MDLRLIDSHAHAQFAAYDNDRDEVMRRASDAGIGVVNVGTQYRTSESAVRLAEQYGECAWATVGFHPGHAHNDPHHDPREVAEPGVEKFDYQKFLALARRPRVVAIGECGLDYYRIGGRGQGIADSMIAKQKEVFIQQIELARETKKPLAIHCRDAFADLVEILSANRYYPTPHGNGVVHFFSGSREEAQKLLDLGFFLGFGGVITFTDGYDDIIRYVPLDRILLETDAPYVAPALYRGRRNEPSYVIEVAKRIAVLKGIEYGDAAFKTCKNAEKLFKIIEVRLQ